MATDPTGFDIDTGLTINNFGYKSPDQNRSVIILERKGIGHPDEVCKDLSMIISKSLCDQARHDEKGTYFTVDSVNICSGEVSVGFQESKIIKPFKVIIGGQIDFRSGGFTKNLIRKEISRYFKINFNIHEGCNYIIEYLGSNPSSSLKNNEEKGNVVGDSSIVSYYYPKSQYVWILDTIERTLLENKKDKIPAIGLDYKILITFGKKTKNLTASVSCALLSSKVNSIKHYNEIKEQICSNILGDLRKKYKFSEIDLVLNNADSLKSADMGQSCFLTSCGSSMESGDDGSLGRGNSYHRVIDPSRFLGNEITYGKSYHHPAILYYHMSKKILEKIYSELGIESRIDIVSRVGNSFLSPMLISIDLYSSKNDKNNEKIKSIVKEVLR